jgi:uncharacterized membrane protein YdjX (TVP38/TMEM64 family)
MAHSERSDVEVEELGEDSTYGVDVAVIPESAPFSLELTNESSGSEQNSKAKRRLIAFKTMFGLLLLAVIVFVIVDTATMGYVKDSVESFLEWVKDNPVPGIFLFSVVYFVATVLWIPGSILTLGAGFVFSSAFGLGGGVVLGTCSVFVGASLGATASFLLARYLLRESVSKLTSKYDILKALDGALQENGLKIFILLRLSPIIPFNAVNYIGVVTPVSLAHYVLALIAILPGTVLYVFLGAAADSLAAGADASADGRVLTFVVVGVGAFFGVLAIWLTTRLARKELNRIVDERRLSTNSPEVREDFPV